MGTGSEGGKGTREEGLREDKEAEVRKLRRELDEVTNGVRRVLREMKGDGEMVMRIAEEEEDG